MDSPFISSSSLKSLPYFICTSVPVRVATSTLLTQGQSVTAASTVCFSGIVFPPLMPSSDVMTVSADAGGREGGRGGSGGREGREERRKERDRE